jgi:hypothetical protein
MMAMAAMVATAMMTIPVSAIEAEVDPRAVTVAVAVVRRTTMTDPVTMPPMAVTPGPIVNEIKTGGRECVGTLARGRAEGRSLHLCRRHHGNKAE